jgi:hypothetical protein
MSGTASMTGAIATATTSGAGAVAGSMWNVVGAFVVTGILAFGL